MTQPEILVQYAYDLQNKRVWASPTNTTYPGTQYSQVAYFYGVDGQQLAAYALTPGGINGIGVCQLENSLYFGSKRINFITYYCSPYYNSPNLSESSTKQDRLGSYGPYFPWGESKSGNNPADIWSYATYWRDSFTGLDYANQRYYSNVQGRFMTPDRYRRSATLKNPQSWNRYAYTRGDPVNRADPSGRDDCSVSSSDFCIVVNAAQEQLLGDDDDGGDNFDVDDDNGTPISNAGGPTGGPAGPPCGPMNPGAVILTQAQQSLLGSTSFRLLTQTQQLVFLDITADASALGVNLGGLTVSSIAVAGPNGASQTELNLTGSTVANLIGSLNSGNFSSWPSAPMVGSPHSGFTGNYRQNSPSWSMQVNTNAAAGTAQIDIDPFNPNGGVFPALGHWWNVALNNATGGDTNYGSVAGALAKRGINVFNCPQ